MIPRDCYKENNVLSFNNRTIRTELTIASTYKPSFFVGID